MIENGIAVPSQSAWSSPCILVPESDGSMRFCTDFRKVTGRFLFLTVPKRSHLRDPRWVMRISGYGFWDAKCCFYLSKVS